MWSMYNNSLYAEQKKRLAEQQSPFRQQGNFFSKIFQESLHCKFRVTKPDLSGQTVVTVDYVRHVGSPGNGTGVHPSSVRKVKVQKL